MMENTKIFTLMAKTNDALKYIGTYTNKEKVYEAIGGNLNLCGSVLETNYEVIQTGHIDYLIIENELNKYWDISFEEEY
jgi:hypothetical protein